MAIEITWRDEFNIGVDIVDKAHQRLFSIVRKFLLLVEEEQKSQHACAEGIKFLKSYTVKHFAEEEAYMLSIGYQNYEMHKHLHDNMRDNTIPALEKYIVESGYSTESVKQFLGICIGWLTGHIMIEDRAITGRISSKWDPGHSKEINTILEHGLIDVVYNIFGLKSRIFSSHYSGDGFGRAVNYRLDYITPQGGRINVIMSVEERLIFNTIGQILCLKFQKVDDTVLAATKQMNQQILHAVSAYFEDASGTYRLERDMVLSADAMGRVFEKRNPKYSILVDTGVGFFAFCADGR